MRGRGHNILITATDKDIACSLLNHLNLNYMNLGSYGTSLFHKTISLPLIDFRMYQAVKKFKPDIFIGFGSIRAAHVAYLLGKPCINFEDTEHSKGQLRLYLPFVSSVCTPSCFKGKLGPKHVRFDGYMELASLHPKYFASSPDILDEIGLSKDDRFTVVRFVSWNASHDIGQRGIRDKVGLVKRLEKFGRVLITSEGSLPPELEKYRIQISPTCLHHLLYYATLYIGEGATTASECAVLGTHAIYVNTLGAGTIFEQEEKYGLVYPILNPSKMNEDVIWLATELLRDPHLWKKGKLKREKLLREKIDLSAFMVWFVENYPGSKNDFTEHPDLQSRFLVPLEAVP